MSQRSSGYTQLATLMAGLFFIISLGSILKFGYVEVERIMAMPLFQIIFTIWALIFFALLIQGCRIEK